MKPLNFLITLITARIIALIFTSLVTFSALAGETITIDSHTTFKVYDGDTFIVNIQNIPEVFGKNVRVRIRGIDAPELKSTCDTMAKVMVEYELAVLAKKSLSDILASGKVIELRNPSRDKYFRILADVYVDNQSVADVLISQGHVKPYDGRKKESWCSK